MPRRKSKNTSAKSITSSNMTGDITCSEILPLATSSPTTSYIQSKQPPVITLDELNADKDALLKYITMKKEEFLKSTNERISRLEAILKSTPKETLSEPITPRLLKVIRRQLQNSEKSLSNCSRRRGIKTEETQAEPTLPAIPEEVDDILGKSKKKIKLVSDKLEDDEEDADVFKKPEVQSKRKLKESQKFNSNFRTPKAGSSHRGYNVAVVTPGPNCDKPISVLRQPLPGEMAISMSGSPLLISHNNLPANVPQISIPLVDGRVMTVLANEGLDPDMSMCNEIDPKTEEALVVLQKLLSKKIQKNK